MNRPRNPEDRAPVPPWTSKRVVPLIKSEEKGFVVDSRGRQYIVDAKGTVRRRG